jgi:hypothetical protein
MAVGAFATELLPFDLHDVGGTDLSDDDARIPAIMRIPVKPPSGDVVVAPPARTKKPARKS